MKEEKNTKPDEGQNEAPSRRDFMRNAVLGAGALAMLTSQSSCEPKTEGGSGAGGGTTNNPKTPIKFEVPKDAEEFFPKAKEFNLSLMAEITPNVPPVSLTATLSNNPIPVKKVVNGDKTTIYSIDDYFTYNGEIPSPTLRVKGDGTLKVNIWNSMPGNNLAFAHAQGARIVEGDERWPDQPDWQITKHLYGPHQQNVTNLHTHGLHVSPGLSKEVPEKQSNIHSDNVLLRIIPQEDYINKKKNGVPVMNNEQAAHAYYEFKLGTHRGPHYPGTHWYHPHPHGATFDQVAGGMAGFIFVEGDVDEFLAKKYAGNNYEEIPLLIQRIFAPITTPGENKADPNAEQAKRIAAKGNEKKQTSISYVNDFVNGVAVNYQPGKFEGKLHKKLTTNQVVRFRVLNGSVDGQGYIRFFVTKGTDEPAAISDVQNTPLTGEQYLNKALKKWDANATDKDSRVCLNNMAFDGITLVNLDGDYYTMPVEWLTISPANRSDFLFTPTEAGTYTVWAQDMAESADSIVPGSINVRVATLTVSDGNLPSVSNGGVLDVDFNDSSVGVKVTVPEELKPIGLEEITIDSNSEVTNAYGVQTSGNSGQIRGRRVVYSGVGHASVVSSILTADQQKDSDIKNELYNAMLIDGKKYGADTPSSHGWDNAQHRMIVNTAEEWTLYNYSMSVYKVTGDDLSDPTDSKCTAEQSDGGLMYFGCPKYQVTSEQPKGTQTQYAKSVHHPFHIHQNPFLCMSIQDRDGNELLPLDDDGAPIPRWQDVVYIPRNGGRVVFRSRFWDYIGKYVNHCHLLQHEDWGMMQAIEVLASSNNPNADKYSQANYIPMPADDAARLDYFPGLNLQQMVGMDIGKVSDTFKNDGGDLANLHFDPNDETYFDQNTAKNIFSDPTPEQKYGLQYSLPTDATPRKWSNEGLVKLMAKLNKAPKQNPGKLPDSYNNRKKNIVGKLL